MDLQIRYHVKYHSLVFFISIVSKWWRCFNFRFHSVAKAQKLLKWINYLVAKRHWLLWQWYLQFKNAIQHRFIYLMKLIRHWILFTESQLEVSLQFEHLLLPIRCIYRIFCQSDAFVAFFANQMHLSHLEANQMHLSHLLWPVRCIYRIWKPGQIVGDGHFTYLANDRWFIHKISL